MVPGPIVEFCSNISPVITPGNHEIKVNVPPVMIPQPSYLDEVENEILAGTFGSADAENHNVYEAQLCPYKTMQYVIQSRQPQVPEAFVPLPPALVPEGGAATVDFLGNLPLPQLL